MDKPELLKAIQNNYPKASLDFIEHLAVEEINRQLRDSINGMLHKKPIEQLESICEYKIHITREAIERILTPVEVKDAICTDAILDTKQDIKIKKRR